MRESQGTVIHFLYRDKTGPRGGGKEEFSIFFLSSLSCLSIENSNMKLERIQIT
jgi:hypothetical protein